MTTDTTLLSRARRGTQGQEGETLGGRHIWRNSVVRKESEFLVILLLEDGRVSAWLLRAPWALLSRAQPHGKREKGHNVLPLQGCPSRWVGSKAWTGVPIPYCHLCLDAWPLAPT